MSVNVQCNFLSTPSVKFSVLTASVRIFGIYLSMHSVTFCVQLAFSFRYASVHAQ